MPGTRRAAVRPAIIALLAVFVLSCESGCQQPPPVKRTVKVAMRDGVKLATDLYLPSSSGRWPVVLVRTPYNKDAIAGGASDGAKRGFAVVVQDSRGRYASEGENIPFAHDARDGYDTVEWIAKQPWCNGRIGTWGGSALGITQLALVGTGTPRLSCQHISVASCDGYDQFAYRGGVFKKSLVEDWLNQCKFNPDALDLWKSHPVADSFWKSFTPDLSKANCPAVHIGGWFDLFTQGAIDSFAAYSSARQGARGNQHLLIGPWTHFIMIDKAGELTFPSGQNPPTKLHDVWQWLDHHLAGKANGIEKEPAVVYYVMGDTADPKAPGNTWRTASTWPPKSTPTPFYLRADRALSRTQGKPGKLDYRHDPEDPVPTVGGPQLTIPSGPMDQRKIESRQDLLAFTSDELEAPLEITGRARARVYVSSDAPDADFFVRLCDVYPDGRSMAICEGVLRGQLRESFSSPKPMKPGQVYKLDIDLWSTSIIINRGHRIRVHVASSCSPGYEVRGEAAHNAIHTGAGHPSHILLPVVGG